MAPVVMVTIMVTMVHILIMVVAAAVGKIVVMGLPAALQFGAAAGAGETPLPLGTLVALLLMAALAALAQQLERLAPNPGVVVALAGVVTQGLAVLAA
jgi:hypothetical protein